MFGKPRLSKEYEGIIREIRDGERRKPIHDRPKTVRDSGFESFVTPAHEVIFEEFDWYAAVVNRHLTDPWAIEETSDTHVRDRQLDEPEVGRTYRVFYNAIEMGRLQVTVGFDEDAHTLLPTAEQFKEHRAGRVLVDLSYMRLVPYEDAFSLINTLELYMGPFSDRKTAYFRARMAATAALTGHIWESVRVDDVVMDFDHQIDGPYDLLRVTTDHWREGGIDPFERWGGDR